MEIIVVIAILGILAAIAVPRLSGNRISAANTVDEASAQILTGIARAIRLNTDSFPNDLAEFNIVGKHLDEVITTQNPANNFVYDNTTGLVTINGMSSGGELTISTTSLLGGVVGSSYNQTIIATGGAGSYGFSASGLPSWLSLNNSGVLSGTPTSVGTTPTFTITVEDGENSVERDYSITVDASTYTLTVSYSTGGSATTGSGTYAAGASVPITATPNTGYQFVNWAITAGTIANASSASSTFTMPSGNATVTANFVQQTSHGLTSLTTNHGTMSPAFSNSQLTYTVAWSGGGNQKFRITPTASAGTITVNGVTVSSGSASAEFAKNATVRIIVTETGKLPKTYVIN